MSGELPLTHLPFYSLLSSISIHYSLFSFATYLLVVLVLTPLWSQSRDVVDSRLQNLRVLQAGNISSIRPTFPLTVFLPQEPMPGPPSPTLQTTYKLSPAPPYHFLPKK
jgi:hypothetical protein